jgi:NAD(P)-dependent dehydrogenase (short-subunit alcohol dehydrogenase family)
MNNKCHMSEEERLQPRTVLITGASSGIGEATVKGLLAVGYLVYAGARRLDRMQSLADMGARLLALDVTNDTSMTAAVETILRETGRIDILINNAGYGSYGALEDVPSKEARRQFEVNLFGLARLIQLVLPKMRAQRSGRIVNISSIGGEIGESFGSWYHASKFAVEGLSDSLRMELHPFGIDVVVIQPGAIRTEWAGIAGDALIKYSGDGPYRNGARAHAKMMALASQSSMPSPPNEVAETIVRAVQARKPKTRYPIGGGAGTILFMRRILSDRAFDATFRMAERQMTKSTT